MSLLPFQLYIPVFVSPTINQHLTLFARSLYVLYEEEVTVKGIPGYRFIPPSKVFANKTLNPANAGFCVPAENCLGSGVLNVSPCKQGRPCSQHVSLWETVSSSSLSDFSIFHDGIVTESFMCLGAPIIMSSPHFYQADEKYVQGVFGMRPQKEQHQTMIDINPVGLST